jgi:hypothetical protein
MNQNPTIPKIPMTRGAMTLPEFHGKRTPPAVRPKRKDVELPTKTTTPRTSMRFIFSLKEVVSFLRVRKNQIPMTTTTTTGMLM